MRDPERIDKLLNTIKLVWLECPDQRLMQLLINALGMSKSVESFREDEVLLAKALEYGMSFIAEFFTEDEVLLKKIVEYGLSFVKDETKDKLLVESGMLDDLIKEDE